MKKIAMTLAVVALFAANAGERPDAFAGREIRRVEVRTAQELFATRDMLRKERPSVPVDVRIASGEYFLEKPFALTAADSGSEAAPVRWGCADGKAGTFVLRAQSDTVPSASAEIKTVERSVAESVENP